MNPLEIKIDFKPAIEQAVRDVLVRDIGTLWDQYCEERNVPPEIKLHGIQFLESFAKKINDDKHDG